MKRLEWCEKCREQSAVVRVYKKKSDGLSGRVMFCLNKGCGWTLKLEIKDESSI